MKYVVLKWSNDTVTEKIGKASFVVQQMTANLATFPEPDPPLAEIATAIQELGVAENNAAQQGGKDRTLLRDQKLAVLEDLMQREVLYVQTVTLGDPDLTALAGMETKDPGSKWPVPLKPGNFRAMPGEYEGSVYLICNPVKYRYQYEFQMLVEDATGPAEWKTIKVQGRYSYTHMGLERGKVYRFRVLAYNAAGQSPYSDEAASPAR